MIINRADKTPLRVGLLIPCSGTQLIQQQSASKSSRPGELPPSGEEVRAFLCCGVRGEPEEGGDLPLEGPDQKVAQTDSVQRGR